MLIVPKSCKVVGNTMSMCLSRFAVHGQFWSQHQWLPVFYHLWQDRLAGRETCGLRRDHRRNGRDAADWGEGEPLWVNGFASLPSTSHFSLPPKAQGSKDGKPKQKVIISDCGEFIWMWPQGDASRITGDDQAQHHFALNENWDTFLNIQSESVLCVQNCKTARDFFCTEFFFL